MGLLAAILIHRPPPIELIHCRSQTGAVRSLISIIYAPLDGQDSPEENKITLGHSKPTSHRKPKQSSLKPPSEHLQLPQDAKASAENNVPAPHLAL